MRDRFQDLRHDLLTPRLPAVNAFGTRLCFYEYSVTTNSVVPPAIPADPLFLNDVAPANRWNCDLLEADGAIRFRRLVENIMVIARPLNSKAAAPIFPTCRVKNRELYYIISILSLDHDVAAMGSTHADDAEPTLARATRLPDVSKRERAGCTHFQGRRRP